MAKKTYKKMYKKVSLKKKWFQLFPFKFSMFAGLAVVGLALIGGGLYTVLPHNNVLGTATKKNVKSTNSCASANSPAGTIKLCIFIDNKNYVNYSIQFASSGAWDKLPGKMATLIIQSEGANGFVTTAIPPIYINDKQDCQTLRGGSINGTTVFCLSFIQQRTSIIADVFHIYFAQLRYGTNGQINTSTVGIQPTVTPTPTLSCAPTVAPNKVFYNNQWCTQTTSNCSTRAVYSNCTSSSSTSICQQVLVDDQACYRGSMCQEMKNSCTGKTSFVKCHSSSECQPQVTPTPAPQQTTNSSNNQQPTPHRTSRQWWNFF